MKEDPIWERCVSLLSTETLQGNLRRLIIADSHIGTVEGDAEAMEIFLRKGAVAGVEEIIYLGDSFQYLIGMEKFWTRSVRRILKVWDELRDEGLKIHLIEGNRDFFLDEPALQAHCDSASMQIDFSAGRKNFQLVHGDKVNTRDFQYLFWSKISKWAPARISARLLPQSIAVAIVRKMEARLAKTNRKFRYQRPDAELIRDAGRAFSRGVDVLLWGHFHSAWRYEEEQSCACIVPAWLETRRALLVEKEGGWSLVDEDYQPCEWPDDGS